MELPKREKMDTPNYLPPEVKHGTTTVAVSFSGGVVLAADNRASAGYMVASPKAKKLHKINKSVAMSIAGSVADAQYLIKLLRAEVNLYELGRAREMPARMIGNLLSNILYGQYRSFFPYFVGPILAGVDERGTHIFPMDIAGSMTHEPWASTGSGSPYAIGVLEAMWKENLDVEEAKKITLLALRSAVKKDIATGDGMDVFVITKDGITDMTRDEIKAVLGEQYPFKE
jgi:proteasome beta subunit